MKHTLNLPSGVLCFEHCFCLIILTLPHLCHSKMRQQITLCEKDWRKYSMVLIMPLKTAEGATVLKKNYFECQIFKKAIKFRLQASWKSKYCHMQWWHKGSEIPIKKVCSQQNKISKLSSISSFCVVEGFFVYLFRIFYWKPWEKTKLLFTNCWQLLFQTHKYCSYFKGTNCLIYHIFINFFPLEIILGGIFM